MFEMTTEKVLQRKTKYNFFLGKVLFQAQYKWRVDKVTFCDRQNHYISRKCHSLYKKE
jgi:hypothetical protein